MSLVSPTFGLIDSTPSVVRQSQLVVDQRIAYPRSAQGGSKPDRVLITPRAPLTWVEPASSLNAFLTKTVPESFREKILERVHACPKRWSPKRRVQDLCP